MSDNIYPQNSAKISVETNYVESQSNPKTNRFVFSYTITIVNISSQEFQLISRHWLIKDANGKQEEVYGEGVIGEQPIIAVGGQYTYTSGAVLETEMGTMEGRYFMRRINNKKNDKDNDDFVCPIPPFVLSVPRILH